MVLFTEDLCPGDLANFAFTMNNYRNGGFHWLAGVVSAPVHDYAMIVGLTRSITSSRNCVVSYVFGGAFVTEEFSINLDWNVLISSQRESVR
jgi:hypothetical protein